MDHVLDLLDRSLRRCPQAPSYCDENTAHTWADTAAAVQRIGTALAALPGGVLHRPVVLAAGRTAAAVHAMLGTLAAGGF